MFWRPELKEPKPGGFPVPAMKFVHFVGCFFNLFFKPESIFQAKSYHDRLI